MFTKKRPDGTYIKNLHFFTQLLPYLMPTRSEACIFYEQDVDVTRTLAYVRRKKAQNRDSEDTSKANITVFYLFLYAALRTLAVRPKMNRFVSAYRYYQRNRISFNFVAKRDMSDEGEEVNVTMSFSPLMSLENFCKKIDDYVSSIKTGSGTDSEKINSFATNLPRSFV
jgi:hypothetical protein